MVPHIMSAFKTGRKGKTSASSFPQEAKLFFKSLTHLPLVLIGQNWATRSPVVAREFRNIDI